MAVSRSAGLKGQDIATEVREMNARLCNPALPEGKVTEAIRGGLSTQYNITDAVLIDRLKITKKECETLGLSLGKPKKPPRSRTKKSEIDERRKLIVDIQGQGLSVRGMVLKLAEHGFKVSRETVRKDYKALGIVE